MKERWDNSKYLLLWNKTSEDKSDTWFGFLNAIPNMLSYISFIVSKIYKERSDYLFLIYFKCYNILKPKSLPLRMKQKPIYYLLETSKMCEQNYQWGNNAVQKAQK